MYTLEDTITSTIQEQTDRTSELANTERYEDATALINEWTVESGVCVLTKFLMMETETIKDHLMYFSIEETGLVYGSFSFDPDAELPADLN